MAWNQIRGYSKETMELQNTVKYAQDAISQLYGSSRGYASYAPGFYKFLKSLRDTNGIDPYEVKLILLNSPELLDKIYHKQNKELRNTLISLAKTDVLRELVFVTLFYDTYNVHRSIFKSLLQVRRYPFDKFDRSFIHTVFQKYKFLSSPSHLTNVVSGLQKVGYAAYLTKHGVKENYDA